MNCQIIEKMFIQSPIAKVLPQGHDDTHSKASSRWLQWVAHWNNIAIQHALNVGKKRLLGTKYKLDGYREATTTAFEYNGCIFHGPSPNGRHYQKYLPYLTEAQWEMSDLPFVIYLTYHL